ncbi:hypothetical protein PUN28_019149 [Cardiocondyla obscurior]|uniref:Uncharacterized protein n=1 Tax=Cardiocondyla obscurior TaxID=286306 RepID=A0AAW2EFU8_9HYME
MAVGRCPFRAPTKNNLADAKIAPFNAPKVEHATKNGMIQDITPNTAMIYKSPSEDSCKSDRNNNRKSFHASKSPLRYLRGDESIRFNRV